MHRGKKKKEKKKENQLDKATGETDTSIKVSQADLMFAAIICIVRLTRTLHDGNDNENVTKQKV